MMEPFVSAVDVDMVRRAERAEHAAWQRMLGVVPAEVASACGLGTRCFDGISASYCSSADLPPLNMVFGLGLERSVDDALFDELVALYRDAGCTRFAMAVAPIDDAAATAALLERRGARRVTTREKLVRSTADGPHVDVPLRIAMARADDRETLERIVIESFGWKPEPASLLFAGAGGDVVHHYLAWDDDEPVAMGTLVVAGDTAWLGLGATLPAFEGRGAQSALIARRVRDAARLGATLAVVETQLGTPEHPVRSNRNLRRLGFAPAYLRPTYIWRDEEEVGA